MESHNNKKALPVLAYLFHDVRLGFIGGGSHPAEKKECDVTLKEKKTNAGRSLGRVSVEWNWTWWFLSAVVSYVISPSLSPLRNSRNSLVFFLSDFGGNHFDLLPCSKFLFFFGKLQSKHVVLLQKLIFFFIIKVPVWCYKKWKKMSWYHGHHLWNDL